MKAIILFFTMVSFAFVNQTEEITTIKATYDGYDEGTYYFTDEDENNYYFDSIEPEALKKYDLTDEEFIGKTFNVTYKVVTKTDEFDEEFDSFVIVKLQLVE